MYREVDLWQYLPSFLKDFEELKCLFSSEQPEFQTLAAELETLRDDFFILTASEKSIARYEKLLKIHPNTYDTLETRRSNVLTRWYDDMPFTMITLKMRLYILQGNKNVHITFDEDDPFHIIIETNLETPGQVDNLAYILDTMLPANLGVTSRNIIEGTANAGMWYGVGSSITGDLFLTNDLDTSLQNNIPLCPVIAFPITETLFLTDDLNVTVNNLVPLSSTAIGSITGAFFYTNDLDCNVEIGGKSFVGMANSFTVFINNP